MNGKKAKRIRRENREKFERAHRAWEKGCPSRLRFIAYWKWKKVEPKESDYV